MWAAKTEALRGRSVAGDSVPTEMIRDRGAAAGGAPGADAVVPACAREADPAASLMARVQQSDMAAYQELIRLYQKKVFRVISAYHRDREDAMEVLQDTFLKVYTARHTWERRSSFAGWLYRIAVNASIDRHRRMGKDRASSLDELIETEEHASATLRSDDTPVDRLRRGEKRQLLEAAVRRLPERQRAVIALRYFGEMRLEEIAETLGCPLGTVKSNLHKAVLRLREMLVSQEEALT